MTPFDLVVRETKRAGTVMMYVTSNVVTLIGLVDAYLMKHMQMTHCGIGKFTFRDIHSTLSLVYSLDCLVIIIHHIYLVYSLVITYSTIVTRLVI